MFRGIRWVLAGLGVVVLAGGGVSVFWRPTHEVLYTVSRSPVACHPGGCVAVYTLEVGNTGRSVQPDVRLRLRAAAIPAGFGAPRMRDFGKVDRRFSTSEAEGVRTYATGPMSPNDRVELSFVLLRPDRAGLPVWDDVLVAVDPAEGASHPGSPAWTSLLRIWYMLARPF